MGGSSCGGGFLQINFCNSSPFHIWHWNQFCLVASQQWLGGCKVRAGNRSIDSGFRVAWNGWGVIDSWKWHLLIALIQSCFTANWVWIWDLDSVSDLKWHVRKSLSTAGLWRLAVKLKVFWLTALSANPTVVSELLMISSGLALLGGLWWHNLVDPASSHMLVSKIKPCMSQYKLLHGETANGSLKQL